jgi:hypothetical protein
MAYAWKRSCRGACVGDSPLAERAIRPVTCREKSGAPRPSHKTHARVTHRFNVLDRSQAQRASGASDQRCGLTQSLRGQNQRVAFKGVGKCRWRVGRVLEPGSLLLECGEHDQRVQIHLRDQKLVGVDDLKPNGASASSGKSFRLAVTMQSAWPAIAAARTCTSSGSGS